MTNPWQGRNQAKEHHAHLLRQAERERRLESVGERGFWARLLGLRRRIDVAGAKARSATGDAVPRRVRRGSSRRGAT